MKEIIESFKEFIGRQLQKVYDFYKKQDLLEEKIFWIVVPFTSLAGLIFLIHVFFLNPVFEAIACVSLITLTPLVIAYLCYRDHNKCGKYYIIFCLMMNCLLFPLTFIANGGLYSGFHLYCFVFVMLCTFIVNKKIRLIISAISFGVQIALFKFSNLLPQFQNAVWSEATERDTIANFAVASVAMIIVISIVMDEFDNQRYSDVNAGIINSIGAMIEFRNLETGDHVHNIRNFTAILLRWASKMIDGVHFSRDEIETIAAASMLHDIGKIAVPDAILTKPERLTDEEFAIMKKHPIDGCKMIESMEGFQNHQYYKYCYEICRHHHEHYDGSGYPDGLKGKDIPIISQVACMADVYEALTAKRVYKEPYSTEKAAEIIYEQEGIAFSPELVRVFDKARPELEELVHKNRAECKTEVKEDL